MALLIRTFIIQAFKIPSGSMIPTLLIGDHLLVNKFLYRFRQPRRGEVVVFKFPEDRKTDFIKRVIALPGDEVELRDGILYINGRKVDDTHAVYGLDGNTSREKNFGPFRVPAKGDELKLEDDSVRLYRNLISKEMKTTAYITNGRIVVDGRPLSAHKVQKNYFFMMGDNRDNSYDSRFWGAVPEDDIVGKALVIYWYWGKDLFSKKQWKRIGTLISRAWEDVVPALTIS